MLTDRFPPLGLRLTTPQLQLHLPAPEELAALAEVAASGIHSPDLMPFSTPWTHRPPEEVARGVVQYYWQSLGTFTARDWSLNLVAVSDGVVVGQQSIGARDFAVTGQVSTGSWLGLRYHGQGIGTQMRAAVLHLAFVGLGAVEAVSSAHIDNAASLAVSRKVGYASDGLVRKCIDGELVVVRRLRLTREAWERHRTVPVTIEGLAPCLPVLGAA